MAGTSLRLKVCFGEVCRPNGRENRLNLSTWQHAVCSKPPWGRIAVSFTERPGAMSNRGRPERLVMRSVFLARKAHGRK